MIAKPLSLPFVHQVIIHGTVETPCTSGRLVSSRLVESEPRVRYLPMMVARLMLSLKKASTSQEDIWSSGQPSTDTSVRFAGGRGLVGATRDEIGLETFRGRDGRIRS